MRHHQHLENRVGFFIEIRAEIISWMITVSRSTLKLNSALVVMVCAGEQRLRAKEREALNFSQSMSWKSGEGGEEICVMESSMMVIIGR